MKRALPLLLLIACGGPKTPTPPTPPSSDHAAQDPPKHEPDPQPTGPSKPVTTATLAAIGLDPDALDRKADPCEDFYQFACGGWMAKTEIPTDKPATMRSFVAIEDRNVEFLHDKFEALVKNAAKDPGHQKVAAFYAACMDEATIDKVGTAPFASFRALIGKVKDAKSLGQAITQLHASGHGVLFYMGPTQDAKDAKNVIIGIDQGGLGLPDRDYYLTDDQKSVRDEYAKYVEALLVDVGRKPDVAKQEAQAILALETEIAKVSMDRVTRRDPNATYHKIDKAGVAKALPSFDWTGFWKAVGLAKVDGVDVSSPDFLTGLDKLFGSTKPETWRAYLTFHIANGLAGTLGSKVEKTQFAFESKLTGQPEMEVRWKRCVAATTGALPGLVGQLFVNERFGGDSKTAAEGYVHAISDAMAANLASLPWMDPTTKAKADEKRKAMSYQIGYPNKWKTHAFKIDRKTYAANALAAQQEAYAVGISKIGKPVDLDDWDFPASLVNAFYSGAKNYMLFPAGILQKPFYAVDSAVPVNLGAMGMVVGHEMTHGFDDQGSKFDAAGNLASWWQDETRKKFDDRVQCVVDQYSKYEIAGVKLNGKRTAGENIADIGGVKLALAAMRTLRASATDTVVADGFTEDQQFFLAFGQAWCQKARPEYEKLLASVDTHSPAKWRIDGTLSATPDFAKAFHCKAGAKLAPAKQCVVW